MLDSGHHKHIQSVFHTRNYRHVFLNGRKCVIYCDSSGVIYENNHLFEPVFKQNDRKLAELGDSARFCTFYRFVNDLIAASASNFFKKIAGGGSLQVMPLNGPVFFGRVNQEKYFNNKKGFDLFFTKNGRVYRLMNYGLKNSRNVNSLDKNIFLIYSDSSNIQKVGTYPDKYEDEYVYGRSAIFDMDSSGFIFYSLQSYDSIYKINNSGAVFARNSVHENPVWKEYEDKSHENLAYLRRYISYCEQNEDLRIFSNYIIVLKRLSQPDVTKKPWFKYFVYNRNLEKLYSDTVKACVLPGIYPTQGGFGLLSQDWKFFYEYSLDGLQ